MPFELSLIFRVPLGPCPSGPMSLVRTNGTKTLKPKMRLPYSGVCMEVKEIDISLIRVSESNVRKDLTAGTEDTDIDDLAKSIADQGLLSPITVLKSPDGGYDLIIGQRRYLACKRLGLTRIPAIVRDSIEGTDAVVLSLIENVHRADVSPMDKARAYEKIFEKSGSL